MASPRRKRGFLSVDKQVHLASEVAGGLAPVHQNTSLSVKTAATCFDAVGWLETFANKPDWNYHEYSQGNQDSVLSSLFSGPYLGTTNKQFVEFGFPDHDFSTSYGNGRYLKEKLGFHNVLLLDGASSNPAINLHKRFVTADNIVSIFDEFRVPIEADYVSVDIDSCDLWVLYALTTKYRPRVITVEYNSNYQMGDFTTQRCDNPTAKGAYVWHGDNIYGSSLSAIQLAAQKHGYELVYVTPTLDAFLVRRDLLCPGRDVPVERFRPMTGLPLHSPYHGTYGPKSNLLIDFKTWLAAHP